MRVMINQDIKFQNRFKELVATLGIEEFRDGAKTIGISRITFNNAYVWGIKPSMTTIRRIAKFFNVPVNYLLGITDKVNDDNKRNEDFSR